MMTELIKRFITSIILIFCFGGAFLHSTFLFSLLLLVIFVLIAVFEWPYLVNGSLLSLHYLFLCLVYPGVPLIGLFLLNYMYRNITFWLPLYPIFIAWTADTCGYLVGSQIGRHKVCPSISPGKSWEGLLASFIGVCCLNALLLKQLIIAPFVNYPSSPIVLLIVSLVQTMVAFAGGIFISYLKRKKGLKDAGHVLPGHGGLLDRFDSVFFIVIAVWFSLVIHKIQSSENNFITNIQHGIKKIIPTSQQSSDIPLQDQDHDD